MKPTLYFYIPVHNEQNTVGVLLYRLIQVMREVDMEYEVHLTLDGCTDDSPQVVEPYMKKLPLLVTQHEKRQGYGKCLSEAIRKISGASQNPKRDFFMVLDADFSIDPIEIKEMAAGIERNTVLYLPDRLSMPKNRVGLSKRMANHLAAKILRRRGAVFPDGIDLLSTVRGCRVQHLRRNMPRLDGLGMLDAKTPPAVSGAMMYLALQDNSKKTDVIEIREQRMRRTTGRFRIQRTLRRLLFSKALERAIEDFEGGRESGGGGGDRRSRGGRSRSQGQQRDSAREQQQSSGGEQRSGSRRSRGGRGRRGRRSGGGAQQTQQSGGQKQPGGGQDGGQKSQGKSVSKPQGQSGGDSDGKPQQSGEQRSGGSRRPRRRRRRPNKPSQGSSNTPQGNSQGD